MDWSGEGPGRVSNMCFLQQRKRTRLCLAASNSFYLGPDLDLDPDPDPDLGHFILVVFNFGRL